MKTKDCKSSLMRILSLSPNISMILAALGLTNQVAGRTSYCVDSVKRAAARPELKTFFDDSSVCAWSKIEEIGDWTTPDADKIARHNPDLVIASGTRPKYSDQTLGIPAGRWMHFNVLTLNGLFDSIQKIGEATGTRDRAEDLVNQLKQSALQASEPVRNKTNRPRIVHERCICVKPQLYANPTETVMIGGHLAPEMIEMAGGSSGLSSPGEPCRWINSQRVVDYQPDIIIDNRCTACPLRITDRIEVRSGWDKIPAIKNKRVFRFNTNIANPNLCFIAGLEELVTVVMNHDQTEA